MILMLMAASHNRKMTAWVNADEFGSGPIPELPDEERVNYVAAIGVVIGIISFIALLVIA